MSDFVWVKNPETGGVWAAPIDYLPVALARGWEKTDAPEPSDEHLHDPEPDVPKAKAKASEEKPASPAPKKSTTTKNGD